MRIVKYFVLALVLLSSTSFSYAVEVSAKQIGTVYPSFSLTLDRVPVQQLIMLFYDNCEKKGLIFDPTMNKLEEVLTIKTPNLTCDKTKAVLADALSRAGVSIQNMGTYDVVRQSTKKSEQDDWRKLIYRPRFRDPVELAEQCMIIVRKGSFAHQRKVAAIQSTEIPEEKVSENGTNGASLTPKSIDKLIFFGPPSESDAVESLLSMLDVPSSQVEIRAGIYEYQNTSAEGSAVSAALNLFNSKFGLKLTGVSAVNGPSLALSIPGLDAALTALDQDSRFKSMARPKILVYDGQRATFNATQDVQVPGAVTVSSGGVPVQSFTTMSAGVSLFATPLVRGEIVDLNLRQIVSSFVPSPNAQPSILRRELNSRLLMKPGLVYMVGGLQSSTGSISAQRLFGWKIGENFSKSETEILLLVTVLQSSDGS